MIKDHFLSLGLECRVESERAHGSYWKPLATMSMAGAAAGAAALRGRRKLGGILGAAAAAAVWDDVTGTGFHARRLLPYRDTYNVVAELGSSEAERTVVLVAHHDAAKSGFIFSPRIPETAIRLFPRLADSDSSPPVMFPVFAGPVLSAFGAATGSKPISILGAAVSGVSAAAFCQIGSSQTVPGANDNVSGVVALLALAEQLASCPPENVRVMFVSTGSEESFMEGMAAFAKRHFPRLPVNDTTFICVDTVGSDRLLSLAGEGMLKLYRYPDSGQRLLTEAAKQEEIELITGAVLRNATDGLYPLKAGYRSAMLGSVSQHNAPANYHWPTDTPENLNYERVADAVRLLHRAVRNLDHRWH